MTIRHQPIPHFTFPDVARAPRVSSGCPLSARTELSECLARVYRVAAAQPDLNEAELLSVAEFRKDCDSILHMLQLELDWIHSSEQSLIFEFFLAYEENGQVYRGWIESLEFAYRHTEADPDAKAPKVERPRENFSELWVTDCQGVLCKLTEPSLFDVQRMGELVQFIAGQSVNGFNEAYDAKVTVQAATEECLGLFGLTPSQVSANMFMELFFTVSHEYRPGQYVLLPGWVQQLCQDRLADTDGEPLPDNENGVDATIAAMMSEHYPLDVTIDVISKLPASQLRSILRSRSRMIERANSDAKRAASGQKKAKKLPKETKDRLMKEFKRGMPYAVGLLSDPHSAATKVKGDAGAG